MLYFWQTDQTHTLPSKKKKDQSHTLHFLLIKFKLDTFISLISNLLITFINLNLHRPYISQTSLISRFESNSTLTNCIDLQIAYCINHSSLNRPRSKWSFKLRIDRSCSKLIELVQNRLESFPTNRDFYLMSWWKQIGDH